MIWRLILKLIYINSIIICQNVTEDIPSTDINEARTKEEQKHTDAFVVVAEPSHHMGPPIKYPGPSNEECVHRIYRDCNHDHKFSEEDLELVRQHLNYTFTQLADIRPDKPLCERIRVRKDWKCLNDGERNRLVHIWRQMYNQGHFNRYMDIHARHSPVWHKSGEFLSAYRWLCNEIEKAMREIDPYASLPYSIPWVYGTQPERASIWDHFGTYGNDTNGHCVCNGFYPDQMYPCVKREWSPRGTIYPWATPEFITHMIQTANTYTQLVSFVLGIHFQYPVLIGGNAGYDSGRYANYDVLWYMHKMGATEIEMMKWQFLDRSHLTPLTYNMLNWKYNQRTGCVEKANIWSDTLFGCPHVSIREWFWVGFGEYCTIPDQMIRIFLNKAKGIKDFIPAAVRRMPIDIKQRYFPYFLDVREFTGLSHILEDVGECNGRCLPIVKPTFLRETETGRRQFADFEYDKGVDFGTAYLLAEQQYYKLWSDMNKANYCCPYVTTY